MYLLDVRKPVELLQLLVSEFSGNAVTLELTGNLDRFDGQLLEGDIKIRDWPRSGPNRVVAIPLGVPNVVALVERILPRVGIRTSIHEIAIKRDGEVLFSSYDNFCPSPEIEHGPYNKGALVNSGVSTELLDRLVDSGIIRSYQPNPYDAN